MGSCCSSRRNQCESHKQLNRNASPSELRVATVKEHIDVAGRIGVCNLSYCKLSEFPRELERISKVLRNLDLSNNKLGAVPPAISMYSMLKSLNCDSNRIEQISDELYKLKRLETLLLGDNRIPVIPPTIGALTALKTVNLAGNRLDTFPLGLTQCRQLDSVNLSRNKLSSVPPGIENLQAMELNLNQNQISHIESSIAKCSRLKVLRLEENCLDINSFPVAVLTDSNVSTLTLDGNLFTMKQFSDLPGYDIYMERYTATKKKMI